MADGIPSSRQPPLDITSRLPLKLIKSEIIPPAPTCPEDGSEAPIDWLLNFAGRSWIAYGASSLLVISHFPSGLSKSESVIGPVLRQVVELPRGRDRIGRISAVSWSPAEPSAGDLGVALDDCIFLYSFNSGICWSLIAKLSQSTKVDAIKWTGSGDGIVSGGIEVVFWRRKEKSWEIAWKFKPKVPQVLISATWFVQGFSATAPCTELKKVGATPQTNEVRNFDSQSRNCVSIFHGDAHSNYMQTELRHPMPVGMIQWRPSTGKPSRPSRQSLRPVLLTCCLDGAVRLWSEIDDGRIKKAGKSGGDNKPMRLAFCIISVIEVNQTLNGSLVFDIFICWAMEVESITLLHEDDSYYSCLDDFLHDDVGRCQWLVGFAPEGIIAFWAVHCLDDFSPVRFPRISLWKTQEFLGAEKEANQLLVPKVFMTRNQASGPPVTCSFIHLLCCSSFIRMHLFPQTSSTEREYAIGNQIENPISSRSKGIIKVDGHTGKILQIAIHQSIFGLELAASLDRNGMLIFWSFSTIFNSHIGLPTSTPCWKLYGKISVSDHSPNYTCLSWAPVLGEDRVLLLGHSDGIDCFILRTLDNEEEDLSFHKLCSIPFKSYVEHEISKIYSIPLPFSCNGNAHSSKFLLVAIWMDAFQALSWEVTVHCYDSVSSNYNEHLQTFESDFSGKKYSVSVDPCSSVIPTPHDNDTVTACAVICPDDIILSMEQKLSSAGEIGTCHYAYHLITGCNNGSLKMWRSSPDQFSSSGGNWELVGALSSGQGSITVVTPSACCQKIATASSTDQAICRSTLCIWECMHVQITGSFMLEDKLCFDDEVIALNWLITGNGHLLLGVCLQNEVRVYAMRRCERMNIMAPEKPLERNIWKCIAVNNVSPGICNFFWGPKGTITVVHNEYFTIFSQFLLLVDEEFLSKCCPMFCQDAPSHCYYGPNGLTSSPIFSDSNCCDSKEPSTGKGLYPFSTKVNARDDVKKFIDTENCQRTDDLLTKIWFWSMPEVAESIGGSLPLYHPEALLINIASGNWKRVMVALRHLVKHVASKKLCKKGNGTKARYNMIPPLPLYNYFEGFLPSSENDSLFRWSSSQLQTEFPQFTSIRGYDDPDIALPSSSTRSEFSEFIEALEWLYDSGCTTKAEKVQSLSLVELLQEVSDPHSTSAYTSLDEPGRRFWVAMRFQRLLFSRRFNRLPLMGELTVSSEMIGFAFHSDCHEILIASLLSAEPSWEEMRSIGVGFWYSDVRQLRLKMERLARHQYMKNKDPKACTLLYIALNRIQVLAGLFKLSKNEKDKPLAAFLSRNFQEDNNKAAALKNAYVLMGKHQLELAVAFFLLGGDLSSAVTVCAKNLSDEQLSFVISRLVEGYDGPSLHNLISKFLLPSALQKRDYLMASFLEWLLGNYSQSFLRMFGVEISSELSIPVLSYSRTLFSHPSVAQYCLMLATKTSMKNAVGENHAGLLCQWAALMNVSSLSRCGLPLEALECHSSSLSLFRNPTQATMTKSAGLNPFEILKATVYKDSWNWISVKGSCDTVSHLKLNLAMQYLSTLLKDHPSTSDIENMPSGVFTNYKLDDQEYEKLLKEFHNNLTEVTACFERKFSLIPLHLISMAVLYLHQRGLEFIGYNILHEHMISIQSEAKSNGDTFLSHSIPSHLLLKATKEVSVIFAKYIVFTCVNSSYSTRVIDNSFAGDTKSVWFAAWSFSNQGIAWSFGCLMAMLQLSGSSDSKELRMVLFNIIALVKYLIVFSMAWLQRNFSALLMTLRPILISLMKGKNSLCDIKVEDLNVLLSDIDKMLTHDSPHVQLSIHVEITEQKKGDLGIIPTVTEDKGWQIMNASLWVQIIKFLEHQLDKLPQVVNDISSSSSLNFSKSDEKSAHLRIELVSSTLLELMKVSGAGITVYCSRQFVMHLLKEVQLSNNFFLTSLENVFSQPEFEKEYDAELIGNLELLNSDSELFMFEKLRHILADRKITFRAFQKEYFDCLPYIKQKSIIEWGDTYVNIRRKCESEEADHMKDRLGSPRHDVGSPLACLSPDDYFFKSYGENDIRGTNKGVPFQNPIEIYKRNGDLLEALCVNSMDRSQAALASHKKGIVFFNWEDGLIPRITSEYLWGEADWPHNGLAGSDSTPIPTCVSPGVGLGSKKGTRLGLGGAIVGAGALPRVGRGVSGGGAFGVPGYAGMGESSLGWGVQESFDEFVDLPATVDNVRTRAFASHPSRPFFMVGSSNTHVYLWKFGEERATATYGVLPAANVPPPYVLASISAVRFDHCGHRFVTAALDGTVSTWQLEVGGRSNIRPTEWSSCFDNHTLDVTYVTASGSIIAAAGYGSNGINVVVWDTLAPPSTSRASIMCHEGGARSLSVFDNDIGSGSISPLILTGGKGGDVGLHDFRYIASGKTKRHNKHLETGEHDMSIASSVDMRNKTGDQNRNGMLWYIPKAHSGSVTKITTIPNTSFFLTGSKDGDVKLWDAKLAKLVFHWPRLHERHTFLQPSSRGFGGVVRAAVTDIQVVSHGFLSCGGDGLVKFVRLHDDSIS